MAKTTKLDLWHKGFVPAIMIGLTVLTFAFGVYQHRRLQAEFQATQIQWQTAEAQLHAAEQREREQTRRAEEYAHRARVEVCKAGLRSAKRVSKTPVADELDAKIEKLKAQNCRREAGDRLYRSDVSQFGQDKAELLWGPAWEQAEKELKPE